MPRLTTARVLLSFVASASLSAPYAFAQNAVSARPGTINYIEGQVSLEGQQLSSKSVGHAELAKGQYLATANGKAELLLTPGVFLRLDNNSTVKMVMPDLTHTEVQLTQGRAAVEVDQLYKQNDILVDLATGQTQLLKNGLYEFDANASTVRVFNGEAASFATLTPQPNERAVKVKEGKQLTLPSADGKTIGFDRKATESSDTLYKWSSLRSGYLGEANLTLAQSYAGERGYGNGGGYARGWLWSPSVYSYTWLPGNGLFWSPFGYGFYSPSYLYGGGIVYGGGYGYGGYSNGGLGYRGNRPGTTHTTTSSTAIRSSAAPSTSSSAASSSGAIRSSAPAGGASRGGGGGGRR